MKNKIFVGLARPEYLEKGKPCIFFPESKTLVFGETFNDLAKQHASNLGADWKEKITYKLRKQTTVMVGDHAVTLVEIIISMLISRFEDSLERALRQE